MQRIPTRVLRLLAVPAAVVVLAWSAPGCSGVKVHQRTVFDRVVAEPGRLSEPEALIRSGMALDRRDPIGAMACYRDAALKALPLARSGGVSTEADLFLGTEAQVSYRRAVEYAVLAANRLSKTTGVPWTVALEQAGVAVRGKVAAMPPELWADALPTRGYEVEGFRRAAARGGLGAPLVLSRTQPRESQPADHYFPTLHFKGATAVIRPGAGYGDPPAVMELHDPVSEPDMLWAEAPGDPPLPLAYDMTVPFARQLAAAKMNLTAAIGVLNPGADESRVGLYMLDPYEPGKIPIVFVHGLASSPEAWAQAVNELRGDPELRKRYQFWLFFYTTGNPIAGSAARLRSALAQAKERFDPEDRDPAYSRMVLIGHSMGGLLSRLSISTSGDNLWNLVAKVPPDQLDIAADLKEKLVAATYFEPVPSVRRVVFVSTPHRGSPLGYEFVGRLASTLIRLPQTANEMSKAVLKSGEAGDLAPMLRNRRMMTSVSQLASDNPMLEAFNAMPISPGVTYHSIVGFNGKGSLETGGDGVVPYTSAHIEGAVSELVVASDHSAQAKEASIVEMRRILVEHLYEYDAERGALGRATPPPPPPSRPDGPTPVRFALDALAEPRPLTLAWPGRVTGVTR